MQTTKKKNVLLLISWIIGLLYTVYLVYYMASTADASQAESSAYQAGTAIGIMIIMPHAAFCGLAVIFNLLGWAMNKSWAALVAGILYAVALVLMPLYFFGVVVEIILCFIGFAKIRALEKAENAAQLPTA